MAPIEKYIQSSWSSLTRSNSQLASAAVDPKLHQTPENGWPVYVSEQEELSQIREQLRQELPSADAAKIRLLTLPNEPSAIREHGLLYLPHPYVVPGGRFNEMYGWDSYFIQLGLLRDGELALAKNMADNFLYEIRHYGKILNANRTYYLSRSQPPFLTQMLLGVYLRTQDRRWLAESVPAVESYYRFWTTEPHLTSATGLSRYFDLGEGPAPEVLSDEKDEQGRTHYDRIKAHFRTHDVPDYNVDSYYDSSRDELKPLAYKGDRSMRESGFDPSSRFGAFNLDIIHYNPVCLNSLLYLMEEQTAEILAILDRKSEVAVWKQRAGARAAQINRLMWDGEHGLYHDYNFVHARLRRYPYLTAFYPLWAGIATEKQAARVMENVARFEQPGGLMTSIHQSGNQWDKPFGWAPLQMIAVQGMRRYGYPEEADRISEKFLSMIIGEFERTGTIVEKYDVVRRTTDVSEGIRFGYGSNEVGFGWTNGAFTVLFDELCPERGRALLRR